MSKFVFAVVISLATSFSASEAYTLRSLAEPTCSMIINSNGTCQVWSGGYTAWGKIDSGECVAGGWQMGGSFPISSCNVVRY